MSTFSEIVTAPLQIASWLTAIREPFSEKDRLEIKSPTTPPAPQVPSGAYTSIPLPVGMDTELSQLDKAAWLNWAKDPFPKLAEPETQLSDWIWVAVFLGAIALFLLLRGRK
jgi:hypothetical protein